MSEEKKEQKQYIVIATSLDETIAPPILGGIKIVGCYMDEYLAKQARINFAKEYAIRCVKDLHMPVKIGSMEFREIEELNNYYNPIIYGLKEDMPIDCKTQFAQLSTSINESEMPITHEMEHKQTNLYSACECGEFPSFGNVYGPKNDFKEVFARYKEMVKESTSMIPGLEMTILTDEEELEVSLISGDKVDMECYKYIPELKNKKSVVENLICIAADPQFKQIGAIEGSMLEKIHDTVQKTIKRKSR